MNQLMKRKNRKGRRYEKKEIVALKKYVLCSNPQI